MRPIKLNEDVVPLNEFKAKASYWLKHVAKNRRPVLITQNGKPAGVLLDPRDYDEEEEEARLIAAITAGLEDANAGRFVSEEELDRMIGESIDAAKKRTGSK